MPIFEEVKHQGYEVISRDGYQYVEKSGRVVAGGFAQVTLRIVDNPSGYMVIAHRPDLDQGHILEEHINEGYSRVRYTYW